jgi:hypothetical protein
MRKWHETEYLLLILVCLCVVYWALLELNVCNDRILKLFPWLLVPTAIFSSKAFSHFNSHGPRVSLRAAFLILIVVSIELGIFIYTYKALPRAGRAGGNAIVGVFALMAVPLLALSISHFIERRRELVNDPRKTNESQ